MQKILCRMNFSNNFGTGKELNDFLKQIQKRGIEKMLEGELDDHLGYEKNQKYEKATRVMAIQRRR